MNEDSQLAANNKNKWFKTTLWIIGIIALTAGLVCLMWFLEDYLRVSLEQYATLAYLIVFVATLLSSSTILFPAPGVAIIMAAAARWDPVIVALVASVGGTLGELTAYYAGYAGNKMIIDKNHKAYRLAALWMKRYGFWAVFLFALIPVLVFDLVGLVAGALRLKLWKFLLACWGGRIPRSFFEAYIGAGVIPLIFPSWFL